MRDALDTDWSLAATAARRDRFYSASQRKFVPFKDPMVFKKGSMQYLWDAEGRKYIDLLGMNVCISVGHSHPTVVAAAMKQAQELTHCTTMFYHPVPAHFAEELAATMPAGHEWVVHFTNSGSEAIDLAMVMARTFTGNLDLLALRTAYHGPTSAAQSLTGIAGFRHPGMPGNVAFVAEPNQYRGIFGPGTEPYLDEIDRVIATATTGRVAGIFVESVQGYGGIVEMPKGYMSGAAERVRAAGGLYVADEVQSGFGRTGEPHVGIRGRRRRSRHRGDGQGHRQRVSVGRRGGAKGDRRRDGRQVHVPHLRRQSHVLCGRSCGAAGHPRGADAAECRRVSVQHFWRG